jgi:glycosyltransferase involved in cell wall biosynthesis/Tfp pilus assembly protein PilF
MIETMNQGKSNNIPEISIGLPVFNGEKFIREALDSLLAQTFTDFEMIISDNGSTDNTETICRHYAAVDQRIKFVRHSENKGSSFNFAYVLDEARGKYFMWASHDDVWSKNYLMVLHRTLSKTLECVLAFPAVSNIDQNGEIIRDTPEIIQLSEINNDFLRLNALIWFEEARGKANIFYGLYRRDLLNRLRESDGIFKSYGFGEWGVDNLFLFRVAMHGIFRISPEARLQKRVILDKFGRPPASIDNFPNFHVMQGYFQGYRRIIEQQLPEGDQKDILLASLAVRETEWYSRVLKLSNTMEAKERIDALFRYKKGLEKPQIASDLIKPQDEEYHLKREVELINENNMSQLLSILIVNFNGLQHLRPCLDSIRRNKAERYEIIILDNASTDGSLEFLRSQEDIILIENGNNIGCPPARAKLMAQAKGDYLILLDNDTVVTKNWAKKFLDYAVSDPMIGIIGPKSNYVSGPQLITNVQYSNLQEMEKFARDWAEKNRGRLTTTTRLVGFCMFITRDLINRIGNIDAALGKFGFEDDDYTWRANIAGFKTVIANDVFIHHTGGPQGKGDPIYNKLLIGSWEKFKEKWNLPKHLHYGQPFKITDVLAQPYNTHKHFIHLKEEIGINMKKVQKEMREKVSKKSAAYTGAKLSLCMIVKNEADNLSNCLGPLQSVVDEIIVVDTGSTDGTGALAQELGGKVVDFPWKDDFSAARNESIRWATGRYILWLDADDRMDPEEIEKLREIKAKLPMKHPKGYYLIVQSESPLDGINSFYQLRLFPNKQGVRFEGRIHEQVILSLARSGIPLENLAIKIRHTGYESIPAIIKKYERNWTILETEIKQHPQNTILCFNAARTLAGMNRHQEAIEHLLKITDNHLIKKREKTFYLQAAILLGKYYSQIKKFSEAQSLFAQLAADYPDNPIVYYSLGESYFLAGDYGRACPPIRRSLELPLEITIFPINEEKFVYGQFNTLAQCYQQLGRVEEASGIWKEYHDRYPEKPQACEHLGMLALENNQIAEAAEYLQKAKQEGWASDKILANLGLCYRKLGKVAEAEEVLKKALDLNPERVEALTNLGILYYHRNENQRALEIFDRALALERNSIDILLFASDIKVQMGDLEGVVTVCDELLKILHLEQDLTIESLQELANLYYTIAGVLDQKGKPYLSMIALQVGFTMVPNQEIMEQIVNKSRKYGRLDETLRRLEQDLAPLKDAISPISEPPSSQLPIL